MKFIIITIGLFIGITSANSQVKKKTQIQKTPKTEKVLFQKKTYECFYCKKEYELDFLPTNGYKIVNDSLRYKINNINTDYRLVLELSVVRIKDSECQSANNRSSSHDWRLLKTIPKYVVCTINNDGSVDIPDY